MAYVASHRASLGDIKAFGVAVKGKIDEALKSAEISGSTLKFYTNVNKSGEPSFRIDLPSEMFLDQTNTKFIDSFAWSSELYPNTENPNLDGKPVMVLALKTSSAQGLATISYSFLNMAALVDTYTVKAGDSQKVISITGYEVEFKVSKAGNNAITIQTDGLHVDISGKADKVTSATAGNFAGLDAYGNLTDSGFAPSTDGEITDLIAELWA